MQNLFCEVKYEENPKEVLLPWKALREEKLSYPMYCLLEESRISLDEVIQLTKDSFYIEINIEIE